MSKIPYKSEVLVKNVCGVAVAMFCMPLFAVGDSKMDDVMVQRFEARKEVLAKYPHIPKAMMNSANSGFGGDSSIAIANHMYSRTNEQAIADARDKLKIESHGDGTWLLRFPYVNVVVFETSEGLVLVDTGYAPAGPALVDALRKISSKPVHTVIVTHHHADHGFGIWALLEAGEKPRIIAEQSYLDELNIDLELANFTNVHLNNQDPRDVPRSLDDVVLPTETFKGKKILKIGGDEFILTHARGETADQIWVSVPRRKVVVSADYHQPFLLNAGNGKRRQRYATEWAQALRDMVAAEPDIVLPMHGPAIVAKDEIKEKFLSAAYMLDSVVDQVSAGLNSGLRQDEVAASIKLPADLANRSDMEEYYNRIQDIGKTVLKEYSGWWNGVPSQWTPAPLPVVGSEVVSLAGGVDKLIARVRVLIEHDPALACQLADWAYFAAPDDQKVLLVALDAYAKRIQPGVPAQEINVYLEHMMELERRLNLLEKSS